MKYTFPHIIDNNHGEKIIFQSLEGDKVTLEGYCQPGCGPTMHTHFKQDEELTVLEGNMAYQVLGEEPQILKVGQSILFKRGSPHKFWAEGNEILHIKGNIQPANTILFYLSAIYAAQKKSATSRPETFDGAYLITKYAKEYDVPEIPGFVKKVIFPVTVLIGNILGKYKHFKGAPEPIS